MKTILYATDYTEHSVSVLNYAYDLSNRLGAELIVLHVYDIPTFSGTTMIRSVKQTQKRAYEEQYSLLKTFCEKHLGPDFEKNKVRAVVTKNTIITEEILLMEKSLHADLIIIGVKDKDSSRGFMEGDIARTLLTKVSCPLLVIPYNSDAKHMKNIVYATDFEEDDIFAIKELADLASFFEATIYVVHVSTKERDEDDNQMEWFKEMTLQKTKYPNIQFEVLVSNNVYLKINEFLNSTDADMIALLEREDRGVFKKLFHRDLVKQLESHTSIPLLSFNSK